MGQDRVAVFAGRIRGGGIDQGKKITGRDAINAFNQGNISTERGIMPSSVNRRASSRPIDRDFIMHFLRKRDRNLICCPPERRMLLQASG
jgi:hypothetical protein